MKSLIIAEKPSLAITIGKAIKETFKKEDGYFESDNYIVTFAFGHLLESFNIEDYEKSDKPLWSLDYLPYIPTEFKFKVKNDDGVKKQFKIISELINRKDISEIVNCGDSDREGQVIVDLIIGHTLKSNKPIKRLWLPEQTEDTIRQGLYNLQDNSDYKNLYNEGLLRSIQDDLIGKQLSRFLTIKAKTKLPVGRVLLPIVKCVYDRDMEIKNFVSQEFFNIKGVSEDESISFVVMKTDKNLPLDTQQIEGNNFIKTLNPIATVINVEEKDTVKKPPKLFSLDKLQNKLQKTHKPNETLALVQKLYEKGFVTYPRTNTEYLSEKEKNKISKILEQLTEHKVSMNESKTIFDDSKVESHSALTITNKLPKKGDLTEAEQFVYDVIKNRFISNFLKEETILSEKIITLEIGENISIELKGKVAKQLGYLQYENDVKDKTVADLKIDDTINITYSLEKKNTKPKSHLNIEELNNFLKNPFKKETDTEDEEYKNIINGLEIGTVATRGSIIENAIKYNYISFNNNRYEITETGIELIKLLDKLNIDLSKEKTVEFSKILKMVYRNELTIKDGVNHIEAMLNEYITNNKDIEVESMAEAKEREVIGKCPRCSKNVYEGTKNFYCEGYKDEPKCEFAIWKENKFFSEKGKKVTKTVASKFLKDGVATIKGLKKKDGSSTYNAKIEMIDTTFNEKKYVNFQIKEFVK